MSNESYSNMFTDYGMSKILTGELQISKMVLGDAEYEPETSQQALVNQRDIVDITESFQTDTTIKIVVKLPDEIDDYTIKEIGLLDSENHLLWVGQVDINTIASMEQN